jgi:hypothetical protein
VKPNISSRLEPSTPLLRDLITAVKRGETKIPKFQRRFVWSDEQALNLLDSIASNYPVGSLLLWRTQTKLAAERGLGDFLLPRTDDLSPTDYVLDGQQRLTVIYSCLGAVESDPGFQVVYDLSSERFIQRGDHRQDRFPLRILYDTTKLLNFRGSLNGHPQAVELQSRLDQLIGVLTNYRIPVVTLKELTVEEVCPIFERINSSGTRLSTYDLMVAATWSDEFDLNDETAKISSGLAPKGFGDIDGDTILKCMAAILHKSMKREQVLALRKLTRAEMDDLVEKVKDALLKAVDLLSTEFKVYSWDFVPYEAVAVILTYVFAKRQRLDSDQVRRVRQWFWRSGFSQRYRGASDTFLSRDLEAIDSFIINRQEPINPFGEPPLPDQLSKSIFRSNSSGSRAFVLLLALQSPRNLTNGAYIDITEALSIFNKKEFHHIYPKAHLGRTRPNDEANSLVNICMLSAAENRFVSDSDPSDYLPQFISEHPTDAAAVFASNLLPSPMEHDYSKLSYAEFLQLRAEIISARMRHLCEGHNP